MNSGFELAVEISEPYLFSREALSKIEQNVWVKNQWPLVYFIESKEERLAYVGESTNFSQRVKDHLNNPERAKLRTISIISSDKFNKSATLDIESRLIQYITAEGRYTLQNGNYGLINHRYYQQDIYKDLFIEIWSKLQEKKIVAKSLREIEDSELFKYSPYKALNEDQYNSVLEIMKALSDVASSKIMVSGSAGTGKTILATYLIKLLMSEPDRDTAQELNEDEARELNLIRKFRGKYPKPRIALVIAMTSLRESLQQVFRRIPGLKATMVISPSDAVKAREKFNLLIVDEAHRLRQYRNIGWMGAFKKNNEKLGLGPDGTELDWLVKCSEHQIFFYDAAQSVKPSDIDQRRFDDFFSSSTVKVELKSQMRVLGGNNYIQFVDEILSRPRPGTFHFSDKNFELLLFDSMRDLYHEIEKREEKWGLCRMVAGYAWPWKTNSSTEDASGNEIFDIELDGLKFRWNSVATDWIHSQNAFHEIGCIHTVQGYDLNYVGVIFGKEIDFDPETNRIEINPLAYHDKNGKKGVDDPQVLKEYIINIYKTLLFRGIKGAFVYACNPRLRRYLQTHIITFRQPLPFRILRTEDVKPFVNSIPLLDIYAAAGEFSKVQKSENMVWVEPPFEIQSRVGYFICQIRGESMNRFIPNGAYCLFKKDEGGSREGKIVLVQSSEIQDADFGAGYTVKLYQSQKRVQVEGWVHQRITLKPQSTLDEFEDIILEEDQLRHLGVVGLFVKVIG